MGLDIVMSYGDRLVNSTLHITEANGHNCLISLIILTNGSHFYLWGFLLKKIFMWFDIKHITFVKTALDSNAIESMYVCTITRLQMFPKLLERIGVVIQNLDS